MAKAAKAVKLLDLPMEDAHLCREKTMGFALPGLLKTVAFTWWPTGHAAPWAEYLQHLSWKCRCIVTISTPFG